MSVCLFVYIYKNTHTHTHTHTHTYIYIYIYIVYVVIHIMLIPTGFVCVSLLTLINPYLHSHTSYKCAYVCACKWQYNCDISVLVKTWATRSYWSFIEKQFFNLFSSLFIYCHVLRIKKKKKSWLAIDCHYRRMDAQYSIYKLN